MHALTDLASHDHWVVWRYEHGTKVPYDARYDRRASSTRSETWSPYLVALQAAAAHNFAGIGFVFADGGGLTGVDLDGCLDQSGALDPAAQALIDSFASYAEVSPSGRGVKFWVRGTLQCTLTKTTYPGATFAVEAYSRWRYFTVTGQQLAGSPDEIADAQAQLDRLVAILRPPQPLPSRTRRHQTPGWSAAYALKTLTNVSAEVAYALDGERNIRLNKAAFRLGQFVSANLLDEATVWHWLETASQRNGYTAHAGAAQVRATIRSGLRAGMAAGLRMPGARR